MQLTEVRVDTNLTQKDFAEQLGVSLSTVARIESAEREGQKVPVSVRMAHHLAKAVSRFTQSTVKVEDLDGVVIAPPRPGRPKQHKSDMQDN